MVTRRWIGISLISLVFLGLIVIFSACTEVEPGPRVWIDYPTDGSTIPLGESQRVISHAFAVEGLADFVLSVDGQPYNMGSALEPGASFSEYLVDWLPKKEGLHTLQVAAYSSAGDVARSELVTVDVVEKLPTTTHTSVLSSTLGTPDLLINSVEAVVAGYKDDDPYCNIRLVYENGGEVPIPDDFTIEFSFDGSPVQSASFPGGLTPAATAEANFVYQFVGMHNIGIILDSTNVISETIETNNSFLESRRCGEEIVESTPTPTTSPTPDVITAPEIQFWAEPSTINAGGCTEINWLVKNAESVFFDGDQQPFKGSFEDCLCSDQRYTLTVFRYDGSQEKRTVDITVVGECVTPTVPDDTPPQPPVPSVPANNLDLTCRSSQNLAWLPVQDPSGIEGYYGELERRASPNEKFSPVLKWGLVASKQYSVNVECGWYYRWRVRAEDGAGNVGNWSTWSQFSVLLQ